MNTNTIIDSSATAPGVALPPASMQSTAETLLPASHATIAVLEAQIHGHCDNFKRIENAALLEAIQCGARLILLKSLTAHGQFEDYVNNTFGISRNRASQWMRLSTEFQLEEMQALPQLPTYSVALELLESRTDTPEIKEVKTKLKNEILVDGEKYSVAKIKELKRQASEAEAAKAAKEKLQDQFDTHLEELVEKRVGFEREEIIAEAEERIAQAQQLAEQMQAEIDEKESAITELHAELTELHKHTGDNLEGDIDDAADRLAELEEQTRDKKRELAKLTGEIFDQEQFYAINKELEIYTEKLKKSLYPHIANLQAIRRRLENQPVSASTASYIYEAAHTLLYNVFGLYELAPTDLAYLEKRFTRCVEAYRDKFELSIPNPDWTEGYLKSDGNPPILLIPTPEQK